MGRLKEISWNRFDGIRNIGDPTELSHKELIHADNVDITQNKKIARRPGRTLLLSGNYHSLYSNSNILLAVNDGNLIQILTNLETITIKNNVSNNRVSYVSVNDIVYYSNGELIEYINGGISYEFDEPNKEFKIKSFAGQILEYYLGRLYIAKDNVLWFSDPLAFNTIDTRRNFIQFPSEIIMVMAVDYGLYISDKNFTYYLGGQSPKDFISRKVFNYPAIKNANTSIDGHSINSEYIGKIAMWVSEKGVCIGMNQGQVKNLTDKEYAMPEGIINGACTIRLDEIKQFVSSFNGTDEISEIITKEIIG